MENLSVIIITKNEEKDIERCLQSVKFAKEIIVLDSGSTDNTVEICRKYTDKVTVTDWPGFGTQKNRVLDKATKDWVLSIDADEWISDELSKEIQQIVTQNLDYSYKFPRKTYYCGKLIKFGHWRNDKVLRLFRRNSAKFSNHDVHERVITKDKIKVTKNHILHNSFVNHEDVLNKMNSYSSIAAKDKFNQGKSSSLVSAIFHGSWAFFRSYILQLGLLDGSAGFMLAISFAEGSYYRYVKLNLYNKRIMD